MTQHLTKSQIEQLRVVLAQVGLEIKPARKAKPQQDQWAKRHAARMSRTMRNVEAYGRFKDARGAFDYRTNINPPKENDPAKILAYYASLI